MSSTEAETPVRAVFERLRGPAALLFLAVNGFLLLVGLLSILTSSLNFSDALAASRGSFLGLTQALLPAIALVLAAVVQPVKEKLAPLAALIAVVEIGVSLLFGLISNFAVFAATYSVGSSFVAFLEGLAWLVLLAGIGFFALQALLAVRGAGRPAGAQGGYGGFPGAPGAGYGEMPGQGYGDTGARPAAPYGGQAGQYPGQPGQPGQEWPGQQAQQAQPQSGPPQPQPGQEWPGQQSPQQTQPWQSQPAWPGQPGQPQPQPGQWQNQAPTSGQPAPFAPPSSGVPYGQPSSGVPYGQPSSGVPYGGGYPGQQPQQGYGYGQPAGGYPGPGGQGAQDTNIVNVNDLLPPDQGQHRPPRHAEDER